MLIKNGIDGLGYFMLDNRNNQGIPESMALRDGLPASAARGLFEADTFTCSHCNVVVVKNPERKRERWYCHGCTHEICDKCNVKKSAGAPCRTFNQFVDELLERQEKKIIIATS
jgi:hypothetical protein